MYNAPSVAFPVGRCAFQRWVYAALLVAAVGVMAAWAAYQPVRWLWFTAGLAVSVGAVRGWQAMRVQGILQWQGESWVFWSQSSHAVNPWQGGVVRLALDAQQVLLLRWTPTPDEHGDRATAPFFWVSRRSEWLWLAKDNAPHHWQDLRRAVFAQTSVF